jgi:hypothetical protein
MVAMVVQPARAAPTAAARPIPEDVPVIRTVFGEVIRALLACLREVASAITGEFPG